MKKISFIFGTRPEAIKLCPLILTIENDPDIRSHICVTAQHREMLDQVLEAFGIKQDVDLNVMEPNQTLSGLTGKMIVAVDRYLAEHTPDMVVVQGDTTTVLCAALAAFYHKIPVGHVEAGLRTNNKYSPFPEEMNRKLATHIADFHFAPTNLSRDNLLSEGIPEERIFVTGNPVIDALYIAIEKIKQGKTPVPGLLTELMQGSDDRPLVLITGHRRENFGEGFENICRAIVILADRFPGVVFVYPVHLNPNVRKPVWGILTGHDNIRLIEPLDYLPFVALMNRSTLILTDSGGVQEEAPSLGKPVLVMRDTTERPEAVQAGTVKLVGTSITDIVVNTSLLLTDDHAYSAMARAVNPYGDGHACNRIVSLLKKFLCPA